MDIREALRTEVNSAMLTFENHNRDNGFFEDLVREFEKELQARQYEPIGICKNIPFPCSATKYSVAFVFRNNGEVNWCHLPETYWFHLLKQCYGYDEADKIIDEIMGRKH